MEIKELLAFLAEARTEFREFLEKTGDISSNESKVNIKEICKKRLKSCTSDFEETCLIENLIEEFEDFMEGLKGE